MKIHETIDNALHDKKIVFADFEMVRRPRGSNTPTSIVSAGLVFTTTKKPIYFNVAPEKNTRWGLINDTAKFLGVSKKEVLSGMSFTNFYAQLRQIVGNGVLVVWGDYDNETLALQCARAGIQHTIQLFNLQEAFIHYFKKDVHLSRMLQDSSFHLPLAKVYKVLLDKEMNVSHNPVEDATSLKDIYYILTNEDKIQRTAIEITLMRLMQTHTIEAFDRYMNRQLEIMTKNLAYQIHGTTPKKSENQLYTHSFHTLKDVLAELHKRVEMIEAKYEVELYEDEYNYIDLSEFGPVDINGDPVGW